eukprot:gene4407-7782_t
MKTEKKRKTSIFNKFHFRSKSQDNSIELTVKDKRNTRLSLGDVSKLALVFGDEDGYDLHEDEYDNQTNLTELSSPLVSVWSKVQYKIKLEEEKLNNIYLESIDIESKLYNSILNYDLQNMEELFNSKEKINLEKKFGQEEETLLHISTKKNFFEGIEILLKNGSNINAMDKKNKLSIHFSCILGYKDVTILLLSYGSKTNIRDKYGNSPLYLSLKNHHWEISKYLITFGGSDLNFKKENGTTILHECMKEGDELLFKFLIKLNDGVDDDDDHGSGVNGTGSGVNGGSDNIDYSHNNTNIYNHLLNNNITFNGKEKLKFNLKDNTNLTPLLKGIENGNSNNLVELLLKEQVDFKCKDNYNRNFFHLISYYERIDIINLLDSIELKKLEKFKSLLEEKDKKGLTCFHISIKKNNFNFTKKLYTFILLLNSNSLNLKSDHDNLSPLELSYKIGKDLTNQLKIEKNENLISIKKNINDNLKITKLLSS